MFKLQKFILSLNRCRNSDDAGLAGLAASFQKLERLTSLKINSDLYDLFPFSL